MSETRAAADAHPDLEAQTPPGDDMSSGNDIWRSLVTAVRGAFEAPRADEVAIGRAGDSPTRTMQMGKFEELRAGSAGATRHRARRRS